MRPNIYHLGPIQLVIPFFGRCATQYSSFGTMYPLFFFGTMHPLFILWDYAPIIPFLGTIQPAILSLGFYTTFLFFLWGLCTRYSSWDYAPVTPSLGLCSHYSFLWYYATRYVFFGFIQPITLSLYGYYATHYPSLDAM
jgi:hypothetical protein